MPRGDGTGPRGMGAMTGRAAGYCSGSGMPGISSLGSGRGGRAFGLGFGRGYGFGGGGWGCRNRFHATGLPGWMRFGAYAGPYQQADPDMEKEMLKNQASALQSELDLIRRRLDELGKDTQGK